MGFGRGALLWLLGIPLPIIICLLFLCITEHKRLGEESCCRRLSFFLFASNPPVLLEQGFRVFELCSRGRRLLSINLVGLLVLDHNLLELWGAFITF
jgi:hypothetical protein